MLEIALLYGKNATRTPIEMFWVGRQQYLRLWLQGKCFKLVSDEMLLQRLGFSMWSCQLTSSPAASHRTIPMLAVSAATVWWCCCLQRLFFNLLTHTSKQPYQLQFKEQLFMCFYKCAAPPGRSRWGTAGAAFLHTWAGPCSAKAHQAHQACQNCLWLALISASRSLRVRRGCYRRAVEMEISS